MAKHPIGERSRPIGNTGNNRGNRFNLAKGRAAVQNGPKRAKVPVLVIQPVLDARLAVDLRAFAGHADIRGDFDFDLYPA